jgi:hypothetical protein
MIGPPFLKLSIRKFEVNIPGFGGGVAEGVGLAAVGAGVVVVVPGAGDSSVTGTEAPGLAKGCVPGAGGTSGAAGLAIVGKVEAGLPSIAGAGVIPVGGANCVGAEGAGLWPKELSTIAVKQRQAISSVFISEVDLRARVPVTVFQAPYPKED